MSLTHDINGKKSAKRYWAKRFFTLGYWVFIIAFIMWIITHFFTDKELVLPEELLEMWAWMMGFGSLILVGTVLERPIKNNTSSPPPMDNLDNVD